jgi:protein O-mannosyl-transferase
MDKKYAPYWFIGLSVLLVLSYANHFDNAFHFDDFHTITNNLYVRSLSNFVKFFTDPSTFSSLPSNTSYRPIVTLSLAFDYWLADDYNPFYFHLSTFVWYLLQLLVMYLLLSKLLLSSFPEPNATLLSAITVSAYALLTSNAETINYVIARADLYSALSVVAGLWMYVQSKTCRKYGLYILPVAIGILSKPPAVMFLPILVLYVYLFEEEGHFETFSPKDLMIKTTRTLQKTWPAIIAVAGLAMFVKLMDPPTFVAGSANPLMYRLTQPYVLFLYVWTFFFPTQLTADTDMTLATNFSDPRIYVGFAFLFGLLITIAYFSKQAKTKPISFGLCWFLLALFPTSWIPLAEVMNDHRIFFPFIGLSISVMTGLFLLYRHFQSRWASMIAIMLASTFVSLNVYGIYQRNEVWHSEKSLWYDTCLKSPKNGRALMNYGLVLMAEGQYEEAEGYYEEALRYAPHYSYLHTNLGVLKNVMGKKKEAEYYFKNGITNSPDGAQAYHFYANWLMGESRLHEAVENYETALRIAPSDPQVCQKLMEALAQTGDASKLAQLASETLKMTPNEPVALAFLDLANSLSAKSEKTFKLPKLQTTAEYINLSLTYYHMAKYEWCIKACNAALAIEPNNADAYNNLCSAYNKSGQFRLGMEACEKALAIRPNWSLAKNNLEWAKSGLK